MGYQQLAVTVQEDFGIFALCGEMEQLSHVDELMKKGLHAQGVA